MSLTAGTRLGSYEIVAPLGRGGMGEVFRARDTRLNRDVALKVLPDLFALDPDRLARFKREAQVLASLNHSNIAHIYGIEGDEGPHAAHPTALVLELVEGQTLAERITTGPIPVSECLPLSIQIARALEAAHDHGVIHRDLKPANVKLRPDGTVKVLDFGLAKALDPISSPGTAVAESPTLTSPAMTQVGVVLGTAAYMSPEQARGRTVDTRADIWAFGCVLFEMLSGQRAFGGDDVTDTIASVVKSEPEWGALPRDIPSNIRTLLERCLRKDVNRRLRDIGDAIIELEEPAAPVAGPSLPPRSRRREAVLLAVTTLSLLTSIGLVVRSTSDSGTPQVAPRIQFDVLPPSGTRMGDFFQLSPDGQTLGFVADLEGKAQIWLRSMASSTARPLAGTEGASEFFWSPDSQQIGFLADTRIRKVAVNGGSAQTLAAAPLGFTGGSWGPQTILLGAPPATGGPLGRIAVDGGQLTPLTKTAGTSETGHFVPHFLPNGRHFLYYAVTTAAGDGDVYLASLDSNERRPILKTSPTNVEYTSSGYLLFQRGATLMAQRFDDQRLELAGEAFPVVEIGTRSSRGPTFSVSRSGAIAYRVTGPATAPQGSQLAWFDRTGKQLATVGPSGEYNNISLSPDAKYVAFQRGAPADIWVLDISKGLASRFTSDPALDGFPLWSPDGRSIAFMSPRQGNIPDLFERPFGVVGAEKLLWKDGIIKVPTDYSRDGKYLAYDLGAPGGPRDIWALPLDGGDAKPIQITNTPFAEQAGRISPDGHWIAYMSNESGEANLQLYVQSFPQPGAKQQVSTRGAIGSPRWSRDGKELFYLAPDQTLMAVSVKGSASSLESSAPTALFKAPIAPGGGRRDYDVAADGRFLINVTAAPPSAAAPAATTIVLNWAPTK